MKSIIIRIFIAFVCPQNILFNPRNKGRERNHQLSEKLFTLEARDHSLSRIEKFSIAETKTMISADCFRRLDIKYHLMRMSIPEAIAKKKKILSPISPKAILAYSVRNLKTGDPWAKNKEKK